MDVQDIRQESHDEDIEQESIFDEANDRSSMFGEISESFARSEFTFQL
jgi:hypothetical protein